MSNKAVAWAFDLEGLTPTQKFLLVALADFADEDNSCFPGQATLAKRVGATRETVSRNLTALEVLGAIRRERRHRGDGTRTSDRFILNLEWPKGLCDKSSCDPSPVDYVTQNRSLCDANQGALTIREPSVEPPVLTSKTADADIRPDVKKLLDLLDSEMQANGGKPNGHLKRNQDAMRLLLDRDRRAFEQVEAAIRWCQSDEFWRSNILSASKLRKQYDQLRLQASRRQQSEGSRVNQNVAEYQRIYGGNQIDGARSVPTLDAGVR